MSEPYRIKDIAGFDGLYRIDTEGQVFSCHKTGPVRDWRGPWKKLKGKPDADGYNWVFLYRNRKRKRVSVHRLVLEAFVGPRPPGKESRHLNSIPANNRLSNLEWAAHSVNLRDRKQNGTDTSGERNTFAKLTWVKVRRIRNSSRSPQLLALRYGMHRDSIVNILQGRTWKE
jgi:hypothetical protein